METKTFSVHADSIESIDKKLSALVKTAKKLDLPPVEWRVTRRWEEKRESSLGIEEITKWAEIEVSGERPKLNGWTFAGTVEHTEAGNIMRMALEVEAPVQFRTTGRLCEHCGTKRYRNDTYLVYNEDKQEWKQVGSSCLKDFTGHPSPEMIIHFCELWDGLNLSESDEEGGSWTEIRYVTPLILSLSASAIRTYGWCSVKQAQETYAQSTRNVVIDTLHPPKSRRDFVPLQVTPEDIERATAALEWAQGLSEDERKSEYRQNLWVLSHLSSVTMRDLGLAVSLVEAFNKEMLERARRAAMGSSAYQGAVGEKLTVKVTFVGQRVFDGRYGPTHMVEFRDDEGNCYVWWTGSGIGDMAAGTPCTVTGKVKEHRAYKGEEQTILTRCKIEEE